MCNGANEPDEGAIKEGLRILARIIARHIAQSHEGNLNTSEELEDPVEQGAL